MEQLYEGSYYLIRQTKKPKYLDFYELEDKDLSCIECYLEQTVRYKNDWYFIEQKHRYFHSENERDISPRYYIKKLYKKLEVINK